MSLVYVFYRSFQRTFVGEDGVTSQKTSAWKATSAPGLIQLSQPKRRTRVLPEKYGGPFKNLHVIKLLIVIEIERTKRRDSST